MDDETGKAAEEADGPSAPRRTVPLSRGLSTKLLLLTICS